MIATSFSPLTVSNLNNGTTTFAVTVQFDHNPVEPRLVETIAGVYDTRGTQTSRRKPQARQVRYIFDGADNDALDTHVRNLEMTDKGKKGTLTLAMNDGSPTYTCTAVLENIAVAYPNDNTQQTSAVITLFLREVTTLV